jgi:tRNA-(ms[2]io[6]A)-hydroxylase
MDLLHSTTSPKWAPLCLQNLDAVLCDHAHCEKKAAVAALSLLNSYPQHDQLVRQAASLAQEELRHFRQVHRFIVARKLVLPHDTGDAYVNALRKQMRHARAEHLMDRLLVAALVEARSCERLQLLGEALQAAAVPPPGPEAPGELAKFYLGLAAREAGHARLFIRLAQRYLPPAAVQERLQALLEMEAEVVADLPLLPRIH